MKKLKQLGLKQLERKTLSRDLNPGRPDYSPGFNQLRQWG
jgi:hypothetical protein